MRAYSSDSEIAIIKDITDYYNTLINIQRYDAIIFDGINDIENIFLNPEIMTIIEITKTAKLITDVGKIIWKYACEPICKISLNIGLYTVWNAPIYGFPFLDFPNDPIPNLSLNYFQIKFVFNPPLPNFTINQRLIRMKYGQLSNDIYFPGYDAVFQNGVWCRGDNWRHSSFKYATRANGYTS